jgi:hypothetical protein
MLLEVAQIQVPQPETHGKDRHEEDDQEPTHGAHHSKDRVVRREVSDLNRQNFQGR